VVWLMAPESATLSVMGMGEVGTIELKQPVRDCGSHSLNHSIEGGDCCDECSMNEGPTCCTGKLHWGAVKKACSVDQYGAPPMDESKDGQMGEPTVVPVGVPAIAVVAQGPAALMAVPAEAPTMVTASKGPATPAAGPARAFAPAARKRRLGEGWAAMVVPVVMLAGAPTTAATPAAGPAGALAPAATKGGSARGWGRAVVVASAVVPTEAPAAATTSTACSREAAAATSRVEMATERRWWRLKRQ
jgi:hypothetical protein